MGERLLNFFPACGLLLSLLMAFPAAAAPVFHSLRAGPTLHLQVDIRNYLCKDGVRVSVLPMLHFADASFYQQIDARAAKAESLLFEGPRPRGFFGPPFEHE